MLDSCISIRLVRTFSLRCLFHLIVFLPSSKTVSLRCSFCFHVDSNRAAPHASNESRLSASRDIRSIRIAITIQRQYVILGFVIRNAISRNCKDCLVTMALFFFAVPAPALLFWAISLCTISVFIPIEKPHLIIVHFRKLRGFTLYQPCLLYTSPSPRD